MAEADRCLNQNKGLCPELQVYKQQSTSTDCIMAVYLDMSNRVKQLCKFTVFPYAPVPQMIKYVSPGIYLVSNLGNSIGIQCKDKYMEMPIEMASIVKVPCNCRIRAPNFRSESTVNNCIQNILKPSNETVVPLAFSFKLKDNTNLIKTLGSLSVTDKETTIRKLPNLTNLVMKTHPSFIDDPNFNIPMSKLIKLAEEDAEMTDFQHWLKTMTTHT